MTRAVPPDGDGASERERRLEEVVEVIQELAALNFDARASVGRTGDLVDAVAAGVNSLGEELEASYEELERRVADRTAELARASRELGRRAMQDDLTGLSNRAALWDRLDHRLSVADRRTSGFAVLFLDLDDFKTVNDSHGHAAGDQVLVEVARRITAELRAGDTAARVGGDEFLVLLDEVASGEAALAVAHRVSDGLRPPHEFGDHRYTVTSSVGVAVGPDGFANSDEVVAAADTAMYEAKRSGRGVSVLYSADRHGRTSLVEMVEADDAAWGGTHPHADAD
ncbi:diguanylate cyclase domain-containing protein [Demequina sp. SO4-18]|uniref:diguanylate cyclase domain-containing protein n=1 Tax=Demequina sp. SO4-18 TaxID=3401026 RepID=UPI003B5AF242